MLYNVVWIILIVIKCSGYGTVDKYIKETTQVGISIPGDIKLKIT